MFFTPEDGEKIARVASSREAAINLYRAAKDGWLAAQDGGAHNPHTQAAAVERVVQEHGGKARADQVRRGLRTLLALKGDELDAAHRQGVDFALIDSLVVLTANDEAVTYWTPEALAADTRAAILGAVQETEPQLKRGPLDVLRSIHRRRYEATSKAIEEMGS